MTTSQIGQLYAVGTALTWTTSAVCFEAAGKRIGSMTVNVLRLTLAVLLLGLIAVPIRGRFWPDDAPLHVWKWMTISGVFGFFLCDMSLFRAYLLIGARRAFLITTLAPVMAALVDRFFFHERILSHAYLGMVVTLAGVAMVIMERNVDESPHTRRDVRIGTLLAFIAAVCQMLGAATGKIGMNLPTGGRYDPLAATFIRAMIGMACFATVFIVLGWGYKVKSALRDQRALVLLSFGAVAGPVVGVAFFLKSLSMIPTGITQTIVATIPVLMLPIAWIRGESISWRAVLGAVMGVTGVALLAI